MVRGVLAIVAGLSISGAGWGGRAALAQSAAENFGGYAVSEGPFTFTGNGLVGTSVGRFTFFNNGLTATRVGNATAWNNGAVSTRLGRNEVFSNGVVGVPTKGGMVFTPGFAPRLRPKSSPSPLAGLPPAITPGIPMPAITARGRQAATGRDHADALPACFQPVGCGDRFFRIMRAESQRWTGSSIARWKRIAVPIAAASRRT